MVDKFPLAAPHVRRWFEHSRYDDYWKSYGIKDKYDKIKAPAYFVTGWYDNLVHENLRNFKGFREQGGTPDVRSATKIMVSGQSAWLQRPAIRTPRPLVRALAAGRRQRHRPRAADQDLRDGRRRVARRIRVAARADPVYRFLLHSEGHANSSAGNGKLLTAKPAADSPPDRYTYDPEVPVVTLGGQISTNPEVGGSKDRRAAQTPPRRAGLHQRTAGARHRSDRSRRDAAVRRLDRRRHRLRGHAHRRLSRPQGDAHLRGYRRRHVSRIAGNPTPIEPGKIYEYTISLWETSNVFKAGHRIRLEVTSSNFPRYVRNQNTAAPLGTSAESTLPTQTIYHDAEHPSGLILPLIPAAVQ